MLDVRDLSVLAYFGDEPDRVYQLAQWLRVLELLDAHEPVGIVLQRPRHRGHRPGADTRCQYCVAVDFAELRADLYAELDAKVVLYCNNSTLNFDSLLEAADAARAHQPRRERQAEHGEQQRQVLRPGLRRRRGRRAAYARGLLEFDTDRLVRIGRPQLDLRPRAGAGPEPRRTVLYAPTWEGDADYNDYSSVDTFGPEIVRALLAVPDVRVVYKPHPRVPGQPGPRPSGQVTTTSCGS